MRLFTPNAEKVVFNVSTIYFGHQKAMYRGISTLRCPFDYMLYQMVIFDVRPDLIIEIGTNQGGGALYLADLQTLAGDGIIHTIDIEKASQPIVQNHPRIKIFTDGWEKYDLSNVSNYKKILVIEDSSHTYANTLGVMNKFADVVTQGSYLIVEDGIINELGMEKQYDGGPLRAIREFMLSRNNFTVDHTLCDFFGKNATFNVNGYLKKI
jgi:cephalosporin hydroxylase